LIYWWARQDSNLQPDRYERQRISGKYEGFQQLSCSFIRVHARLFMGFLWDFWWAATAQISPNPAWTQKARKSAVGGEADKVSFN
jgi:hypothetical protein